MRQTFRASLSLTLLCFLLASRTRLSVLPSASTRFLDCAVHRAALVALAPTNDAVGLADASCLLLDARTMADDAAEASVWCARTSKLAPNSGVRDQDLAPECFFPRQRPDRSPSEKADLPSSSVESPWMRRGLRSPRREGYEGGGLSRQTWTRLVRASTPIKRSSVRDYFGPLIGIVPHARRVPRSR